MHPAQFPSRVDFYPFCQERFICSCLNSCCSAFHDYFPWLITGISLISALTTFTNMKKKSVPAFGFAFPARRMETQQDWDDLVLDPQTLAEVKRLEAWLKHGDTLIKDWGMRRKIKPGFRALFYGPPGTGKSLAASLLGKSNDRDVYSVDLSMVVSKFIGETEKNLSNLFAKAENKNWILFFDEADALFGKRTEVKDSHDRYANQEVSYLLQRLESFPGLAIVALSLKGNIDGAFIRRFQSIVHFPMPGARQRLMLWQKAFPEKVELGNDIDLEILAEDFELSGENIINVVQSSCLRALSENSNQIKMPYIVEAVRNEFRKAGNTI